jgi:hypothetical protein
MSMLRASGRQPSVDTLARFVCNLKFHYDAYKDSQHDIIRLRKLDTPRVDANEQGTAISRWRA